MGGGHSNIKVGAGRKTLFFPNTSGKLNKSLAKIWGGQGLPGDGGPVSESGLPHLLLILKIKEGQTTVDQRKKDFICKQ